MELVLVPGADHELAIEPSFAERPADVIADIGDHAELAIFERHGHEPLAEFRLAQRRAFEVFRRADVDPLPRWSIVTPRKLEAGRNHIPYTRDSCTPR